MSQPPDPDRRPSRDENEERYREHCRQRLRRRGHHPDTRQGVAKALQQLSSVDDLLCAFTLLERAAVTPSLRARLRQLLSFSSQEVQGAALGWLVQVSSPQEARGICRRCLLEKRFTWKYSALSHLCDIGTADDAPLIARRLKQSIPRRRLSTIDGLGTDVSEMCRVLERWLSTSEEVARFFAWLKRGFPRLDPDDQRALQRRVRFFSPSGQPWMLVVLKPRGYGYDRPANLLTGHFRSWGIHDVRLDRRGVRRDLARYLPDCDLVVSVGRAAERMVDSVEPPHQFVHVVLDEPAYWIAGHLSAREWDALAEEVDAYMTNTVEEAMRRHLGEVREQAERRAAATP